MNERQLGVGLFNDVWRLLEQPDRTREENDRLVHQGARLRVPLAEGTRVRAEEPGRSEWMCSRVYAVLGRAEPALQHARRCLAIAEANPENMEEFDLPFAYEALARPHRVAGDAAASSRYGRLAHEAAERVEDAGDRQLVLSDLATL